MSNSLKPRPRHHIRMWSESRMLPANPSKGRKHPKPVMVFRWECWGQGCVKDGKPFSGSETLFQTKRDIEIDHHKELP